MAMLWPILWICGILTAIVAFFVAMFRENAKKRAAVKRVQERQAAMNTQAKDGPDFGEENLDFPNDPLS